MRTVISIPKLGCFCATHRHSRCSYIITCGIPPRRKLLQYTIMLTAVKLYIVLCRTMSKRVPYQYLTAIQCLLTLYR